MKIGNLTGFENWNYQSRDLIPGEIALLDRIYDLAGKEGLTPNKMGRFLHMKEVKIERVEVTLGGLRMLRSPGWVCIWNPTHETGNTVHLIVRQKFDTDLVLMRMYLS